MHVVETVKEEEEVLDDVLMLLKLTVIAFPRTVTFAGALSVVIRWALRLWLSGASEMTRNQDSLEWA